MPGIAPRNFKDIQIQPTAQANRVLGEPTARLGVVPPHAKVDEACRRRPLAALEAIAISVCDAVIGSKPVEVVVGVVLLGRLGHLGRL